MTSKKYTTMFLSVLLCGMASTVAYAVDGPEQALQPDNTRVNMRDRDAGEATADQQKENDTDRGMTKEIRQSIMDDESLSSYAHNIKIISQNGSVTLKGPVRSEREKQAIIDRAVTVVGDATKVTDQISIKR